MDVIPVLRVRPRLLNSMREKFRLSGGDAAPEREGVQRCAANANSRFILPRDTGRNPVRALS